MLTFFDSMKGQAIAALVIFLAASHLLALLVYAKMSEDANNLLHDALVAEQIALVTTLVESFPEDDRGWIIDSIDVPSLHVTERNRRGLGSGLPEGTRAHNFEHLLSAILDRPIVKSIGLGFSPKGETSGLKKIWKLDSDHAEIPRDDLSHVPQRALKDIVSNGTIEAEIMLHNGSWLLFDTPVLSVNPFSTWRFGASLLVGLLVTIFVATWVLTRWSEPLTVLAHAAERFAGDVKAPPLLERGPSEVRVAVQAFNRMQEQLRCLIEDRIQLAAAIAHDLGTPITRLRLRAEAIESDEQRGKFLDDLTQMQRMIGAALDFARQDMAFEPFEALDLSSLLQSLSDEFTDMQQDVVLEGPDSTIGLLRPYAVRRALTNVIENAVKYGKRARVRLSETPTGHVIVIDDDGPGIPEQMHSEVLRPFRRLEQPDQELTQGAGLGLAVVRTVVHDHGGTINLTNRREGGLRVTITLPCNRMNRAA